jgi:hypothetical protein
VPIFIPSIAPQSPPSIIWGLYNGLKVAAVSSGLSPTPLIIIIIGCDGMDWINLAEGRDQWRALVSTVMNLRVP